MPGRARRIRSLLALTLAASTMGCALGTRHTFLTYPPAAGASRAGVGVAEAASAPANMPIVLMPFKDGRSNQKSIGAVRNGLNMRTASVVADNDVAQWVTRALKLELEKAGYRVTESDAPADSTGPTVLSGDVLTVFGDAYLTYTGEVSFVARVARGGKQISAKRYTGNKTSGMSFTASGGGYGNALSAALAEAVGALVSDLGTLLRSP